MPDDTNKGKIISETTEETGKEKPKSEIKYIFKYAITKINPLLREEEPITIGSMPIGEEEKESLITLLRKVQHAKADITGGQLYS